MKTEQIPAPLTATQLQKHFNQYLFLEKDARTRLSASDEMLYHLISSELDQQEKLSQYIPSPPTQLLALLNELEKAETDFDKLRKLIEKDLALLGEVIRISNGPLFRPKAGEVPSIEKAISLLGIQGVMQIACTVMLRQLVFVKSPQQKAIGELLWKHCLRSADSCRLAGNSEDAFPNYLLGLLHDIGTVSIFNCFLDLTHDPAAPQDKGMGALQKVILEKSPWLSSLIAAEWGLPESYLMTLNDYKQYMENGMEPSACTTFSASGLALVRGSLATKVHTLIGQMNHDDLEGRTLLRAHGLDDEQIQTIFDKLSLLD